MSGCQVFCRYYPVIINAFRITSETPTHNVPATDASNLLDELQFFPDVTSYNESQENKFKVTFHETKNLEVFMTTLMEQTCMIFL